MNIPALKNNDHFLVWLVATMLLLSFGFGDAAIVVWSASLISSWELFAAAFSFLLVEMGVLYTVWKMRR